MNLHDVRKKGRSQAALFFARDRHGHYAPTWQALCIAQASWRINGASLGIAQQRPHRNNKLIQIQAQISADCRNLMGIGPPNFM
jgi:hypothetical protein